MVTSTSAGRVNWMEAEKGAGRIQKEEKRSTTLGGTGVLGVLLGMVASHSRGEKASFLQSFEQ